MQNHSHPLSKFRFCPACGNPEFEINDCKSKRCPHCGFVYYLNPSAAVVAVIMNKRNELLVVRRAKEPAKGTLDLPGGFSDCYESSEESAAREVLEETGLKVGKVEFLFSLPNIYPYGGMDIHTLDMFYRCEVESDSQAKAADDASEVMWIPWDRIRPEDFGLCSIRRGIEILLFEKTAYR